MKKYFYTDGSEKYGPLSIDELFQENISSETLIWFSGLDNWVAASELEEMKPILELKPPPILRDESETIVNNFDEKPSLNINNKSNSKFSDEHSHRMFSKPFSLEGRIRRTEYGISFIVVVLANLIINSILESGGDNIIFAYIPTLWFFWAQGAKRCHDLGNNGWFQIIPFYPIWMIFAGGNEGMNKYGLNPKG